ncbi:MAG: VCBS repeat-containing protein [Bacteroidetes bacterium]|nr:VCBS repeat-containing protein [Bacteroidota bacterium]
MFNRIHCNWLVVAVCLLFCACGNPAEKRNNTNTPLFELLDAATCGVAFSNTVNETAQQHIFTYQYFYNGAGVATGDLDNDGKPEIFFTANQASSKLFHNKGNLKFDDITSTSGTATTGWCTGVTMVDINADGWLDIYLCRSQNKEASMRTNLLFINQKNLTFKEEAAVYGLADAGYSNHATFFDYDNDGDLDMFLCNHTVVWDFKIEKQYKQNEKKNEFETNKLYRNDNGKFIDATSTAGLQSNAFSLSAIITDMNNDGWQDLYVCNDYTMNDFAYINQKSGTFKEDGFSYFRHTSKFSMGCDAGDVNNDGLMDIVTLDMLPETSKRQKMLSGRTDYDHYYATVKWGYGHQLMRNMLQLNNGNNTYSDIGCLAGIEKTDWSWTALLADFDNDAWNDLYVTNGYLRDFTDMDFINYGAEKVRSAAGKPVDVLGIINMIPSVKLSNYCFRNNANLTFSDNASSWGLSIPSLSNGASYSDLDNDGDLDLVVNNINDNAFVFKNNTNSLEHNFLQVKFKGDIKNPFGIGTTVTVKTDSVTLTKINYASRGYLSSVEPNLHFGLGKTKNIVEINIRWPDGKVQKIVNAKPNQTMEIKYSDATSTGEKEIKPEPLFVQDALQMKLNHQHLENEFIDFKREPLIPHTFSQSGPHISVSDVNGDGAQDFYIGGAAGQAGVLYVQQENGTFKKISAPFTADAACEDLGSLFFDADGDKDIDLYVCSGGSEFDAGSEKYQDRIYMNDGNGNFSKNTKAIPAMNTSSSCAVALDYDNDNDLDLYVGGFITPGSYPVADRSYLLQNNKGTFTDVTVAVCEALLNPGIIYSAVAEDIDNDQISELIIAGEWTPIQVFKCKSGKITLLQNNGLEKSNGWWRKIICADVNNDGVKDIVAGNMGLNSRLTCSADKPVSVFYNDIDSNGTMDALLCYYYSDGKQYPIAGRDEVVDQIRSMRKRYLTYGEFASKTINELLTPDELKFIKTLNAYTFANSVAINKGGGNFSLSALPMAAQFSPVNGLVAEDINGDNKTDLILAGNHYGSEVNIGVYDAGNGCVLVQEASGGWKSLSTTASGWFTANDVKDVQVITQKSSGKKLYLIANNNNQLQVYSKR